MGVKIYPSDLSDEEWKLLEDFAAQGKMGSLAKSIRKMINAFLYAVKTGCQWRALPRDYPYWKTV
jgi:putative transposase